MPLGKNADAGDYVDDFKKSKAPQFKGKSKKKRRQMAIAAYLSNKNELANFIREVIKEADPKKGTGKKPKGSSRRLYTDENPKDTVSVKFSSRQDIVDTLSKSSFKSKSHARQSQIINLIHQRTRAAYGRAKDPAVKKRLKTALDYITSRKEASKRKTKRMKKEGLKGLGRGNVGTRYRAITKKGGKFYYDQDDALGQGIRQSYGPFKTKAAAKRKMQSFAPGLNYRDLAELVLEGIGMDYLNKTARAYFGEENFDAAVKDGNAPNANDVAFYISKNETDEIEENNLQDFLKKNDYEEKQVAEYQFDEEKYDFSKMGGAGEYDSSIIIFKVVDKSDKLIPIPGDNSNKSYPYLATTDRGSLSEFYPLLEAKHVKILKSIADIFEPNQAYENFKGGKEKEIVDDILSGLNEGMLDGVLDKMKKYASKGLLTLAILSSVLQGLKAQGTQQNDLNALKQQGIELVQQQKQQINKQVEKQNLNKVKKLLGNSFEKMNKLAQQTGTILVANKGSNLNIIKNRNLMNAKSHYSGSVEKASLQDQKVFKAKDGKYIVVSFYQITVNENYKDGKVKGKSRPGRVKKAGASCKGSVTSLRAKAKRYGGEKGKMYHWCANMKGGKKK